MFASHVAVVWSTFDALTSILVLLLGTFALRVTLATLATFTSLKVREEILSTLSFAALAGAIFFRVTSLEWVFTLGQGITNIFWAKFLVFFKRTICTLNWALLTSHGL